MEEIETSLVCSHCFKESPVRITYLENSTVALTCRRCGYTIRVSPRVVSDFSLVEWEHRLLTKPGRLASEMRKDSLHFLSNFPLRVITKPLRVAQELEKSLL